MKPQELRIGNYVKYNGSIVSVYAISNPIPNKDKHFNNKSRVTLWCNGLIDATIDEIEPIPITEEWLTKSGFVKRIYSDKIFAYGEGMLSTVYFIESTMIDIRTEDNNATILCKHLHHLQNAYYLVTGKELEIKV